MLAALVLGGAQVTIPQGLRESFRVAGLSHALAASGFHLSVLLGATLAIGRFAGRAARLVMAALTLVGFVLMAGAQPSVVRSCSESCHMEIEDDEVGDQETSDTD